MCGVNLSTHCRERKCYIDYVINISSVYQLSMISQMIDLGYSYRISEMSQHSCISFINCKDKVFSHVLSVYLRKFNNKIRFNISHCLLQKNETSKARYK